MSTSLMYGLGEADGNNYICSKDLRPGKSYCFPLFFISLCCRALKLAKLECVTLPFLPLYLSRPRFLAETESRKRRLNQGSFVSAVSAVCLVVYFLWFVLRLSGYFLIYIEYFPYCFFVGDSQVNGSEDRLRNDLYCVGWCTKLCSIQSNPISLPYTSAAPPFSSPLPLVLSQTVYLRILWTPHMRSVLQKSSSRVQSE